MIRGISFHIPNGYLGLFSDITKDIEINRYFWFVSEDQVFNKSIDTSNEFFFDSERYIGNDFQKKVIDKNYYVIFANLQAYLSANDFIKIDTYDDFQNSNCEIVILISDGIFVDVYAKDKNIIEAIRFNAQHNNFSEIAYITDENDNRTEFCAL